VNLDGVFNALYFACFERSDVFDYPCLINDADLVIFNL
jgi:hypothetical protein